MVALDGVHDRRTELIDGEFIDLAVPSHEHCVSAQSVFDQLEAGFGADHWARMQMPLDLGPTSEPLPDIAVVAGTPRQFTSHPRTAIMVVEVSDSSLNYDRTRKAPLYAAAAIAEYWIVNLEDGELEIYRDPQPDPTATFGFRYFTTTVLRRGDSVTPLAAPRATIAVSDLLP